MRIAAQVGPSNGHLARLSGKQSGMQYTLSGSYHQNSIAGFMIIFRNLAVLSSSVCDIGVGLLTQHAFPVRYLCFYSTIGALSSDSIGQESTVCFIKVQLLPWKALLNESCLYLTPQKNALIRSWQTLVGNVHMET